MKPLSPEERQAYGQGFHKGRRFERRVLLAVMLIFGFLWAAIVHWFVR